MFVVSDQNEHTPCWYDVMKTHCNEAFANVVAKYGQKRVPSSNCISG